MFRNINFNVVWPDKDNETAQKHWWFVFDAIEDYGKKCEMLLTLLEANTYFQIIDEAFYMFDLIPAEFKQSTYTPIFAKELVVIAQALTNAVFLQSELNDINLNILWKDYEREHQKLINSQVNRSVNVQPPENQKEQLEWDKPKNEGFKIFITPDGNIYGRIDFGIPNNKLPEVFNLFANLQQSIKEFCDSDS